MIHTTPRNGFKVDLGMSAIFNGAWRDLSLQEIDSLYEIANAELPTDKALYNFLLLNPNDRVRRDRLTYEVKKIAKREFGNWMIVLHPNVCHRVAERLVADFRDTE